MSNSKEGLVYDDYGRLSVRDTRMKSRNMDNLMDCMGLLDRAYNEIEKRTKSPQAGFFSRTESKADNTIMDDINVFRKKIRDREQ